MCTKNKLIPKIPKDICHLCYATKGKYTPKKPTDAERKAEEDKKFKKSYGWLGL